MALQGSGSSCPVWGSVGVVPESGLQGWGTLWVGHRHCNSQTDIAAFQFSKKDLWQHLERVKGAVQTQKPQHKLSAASLFTDSNNSSSRKLGQVPVLAPWTVGSGVGQILESSGERHLLDVKTAEYEDG